MKYFFTSVNNAYIPKAAVLAESLRNVYRDAYVFCVLSDMKSADIDYTVFDRVLTIEDLDIPVPCLESWVFSHTVVELCTAVKPFAFKKIFSETGAGEILYMDPDTVLYSPMDEVYEALINHPVVLTPHVSVPAADEDDLLDGEMLGCLRHGVFNLGFLALANYGEGKDFLDWWADRCLKYCYDDGPRGLFTDQRWIDLAPCFFESLKVLRLPTYNVATWNLYYREIGKDGAGRITRENPRHVLTIVRVGAQPRFVRCLIHRVDESRLIEGLRGIELGEPLPLRLAGGARLAAVATGLQAQQQDKKQPESKTLLPPAPRAEARRVAAAVLRDQPFDIALTPHPRSALRRRIGWALWSALAVAVLVAVPAVPGWIPMGFAAALVVLALLAGLGFAVDAYRGLGHALDERYLLVRNGSAMRRTVALQRENIIGWRISRTVFQRRADLMSVGATTVGIASGGRGPASWPRCSARNAW